MDEKVVIEENVENLEVSSYRRSGFRRGISYGWDLSIVEEVVIEEQAVM